MTLLAINIEPFVSFIITSAPFQLYFSCQSCQQAAFLKRKHFTAALCAIFYTKYANNKTPFEAQGACVHPLELEIVGI